MQAQTDLRQDVYSSDTIYYNQPNNRGCIVGPQIHSCFSMLNQIKTNNNKKVTLFTIISLNIYITL